MNKEEKKVTCISYQKSIAYAQFGMYSEIIFKDNNDQNIYIWLTTANPDFKEKQMYKIRFSNSYLNSDLTKPVRYINYVSKVR